MDKTWRLAGLGAVIMAASGVSTILVHSISIRDSLDGIFNRSSIHEAYDFIHDLHDAISSSDHEAIRFVNSNYANSVDFYGSTSSIDFVIEDKRKLFRRWPKRDYYFSPIEEESECKGARCIVVGTTHYYVSNENGLSKSDTAKYKYTLERDNGDYKIVAEVNWRSRLRAQMQI